MPHFDLVCDFLERHVSFPNDPTIVSVVKCHQTERISKNCIYLFFATSMSFQTNGFPGVLVSKTIFSMERKIQQQPKVR